MVKQDTLIKQLFNQSKIDDENNFNYKMFMSLQGHKDFPEQQRAIYKKALNWTVNLISDCY